MGLVPVDKKLEEFVKKKARQTGQSKGDILATIIERARQEAGGSPEDDLSRLERISRASTPKEGTMADKMKDYMETMMLAKIAGSMGNNQQPQRNTGMGDITQILAFKELTKPSIYEIMMLQNLGSGKKGETPEWVKTMAAEQKETRELLKKVFTDKQEIEKTKAIVDPLVAQMTADREAYAANQNEILAYITKGEGAGTDTIEGYIANALKERLTDQALDAIDRGLFQRKEIVTPEGGFDWKGILDRMLTMGEEVIKKMPTKQPPVMPVRTMDGRFLNPATGQVLNEKQAAHMMHNARLYQMQQGQQMQPLQPGGAPQPPGEQGIPAGPPAAPQEQKAAVDAAKKKRTSEAIETFTGGFEETEEQSTEEQQSPEQPTGDEEY